MRIALFGGSFDPPHLGHVLAAVWARSVGQVDAVWVLPVHEHPYGKQPLAFADRLELCRLAFTDLPWVTVRDDESRNPGGFTIGLVELLEREHPGHTWLLVGGTDTARDLPNWRRGDELAQRLAVLAVPRGGCDDHPGALPAISSSLVRQRLSRGLAVDGLLPSAVQHRIAASGWYR